MSARRGSADARSMVLRLLITGGICGAAFTLASAGLILAVLLA